MLAPAMAWCPALLTAAPRHRRGCLSAGAPGSLLAAAPPRPPFPQPLAQFLQLRSRRLQFAFQPLLSLHRLAMHSAVIARLPALLYYLAPQLRQLSPARRRAATRIPPEPSHTSFLSTPIRLCPARPTPVHRIFTRIMCGARTSPTIPVQGGFLYLVAITDWASRRVLAWRLSNTMDTEFSAWRCWRRLWKATVFQRSSTPIRAASSPVSPCRNGQQPVAHWPPSCDDWTRHAPRRDQVSAGAHPHLPRQPQCRAPARRRAARHSRLLRYRLPAQPRGGTGPHQRVSVGGRRRELEQRHPRHERVLEQPVRAPRRGLPVRDVTAVRGDRDPPQRRRRILLDAPRG